jgi:restriction system protein
MIHLLEDLYASMDPFLARRAMSGQTDRGIFITTGTFTRSVRQEVNRDGVSPIDLVDGEMLMDKLKELGLGVNIQLVEHITVDGSFFENV